MKTVFAMCCCFLAITYCQEDPYIGLWMAMLGKKAITTEMARLQGTGLYHGITGQKRHSGLVMDIWGGSFGMITSLPNIRNCSA